MSTVFIWPKKRAHCLIITVTTIVLSTVLIFFCGDMGYASCTIVSYSSQSSGLPPTTEASLKIAVATNFYEHGVDVVTQFLKDPVYSTATILVCHGSNSSFIQLLLSQGNIYNYSLFLSSDQDVADIVANAFALNAFHYASVINVLYSHKLSVPQMYNTSESKIILGTGNVETFAVTDPDVTSNSAATVRIENDFLDQKAELDSISIFYPSIKETYDSVYNEIKDAGFVEKNQICTILPSAAYVQFPANFDLPLYGTLVKIDTEIIPLANTLKDYLLSPAVQTRLVNSCYRAAVSFDQPNK
ncbi:MAG: hypothetical protein LBP22_10085 [Deltaproteobacteria bacterium]|jgi:hypothetical protein|nr:hypothetical protein [Deltaproteobacteria bacterium]